MAHSSKPVGAFVKAIFVIASSVRPMMWLAASGYEPRDHVLHANSTLVDRVDLATAAIAVLSTGYRPLGSCPRSAGWSGATSCFGPSRHFAAAWQLGRFQSEAEIKGQGGSASL